MRCLRLAYHVLCCCPATECPTTDGLWDVRRSTGGTSRAIGPVPQGCEDVPLAGHYAILTARAAIHDINSTRSTLPSPFASSSCIAWLASIVRTPHIHTASEQKRGSGAEEGGGGERQECLAGWGRTRGPARRGAQQQQKTEDDRCGAGNLIGCVHVGIVNPHFP